MPERKIVTGQDINFSILKFFTRYPSNHLRRDTLSSNFYLLN